MHGTCAPITVMFNQAHVVNQDHVINQALTNNPTAMINQVASLSSIGLLAMLAGGATLVVASIAGWGIAADRAFAPVRWLQGWLGFIVHHCLTARPGWQRALVIFINNTTVTGLLVASGAVPWLAWAATCLTGLALGGAVRLLATLHPAEQVPGPTSARSLDAWSAAGLLLNLLEIPAIIIALGLAFGQHAVTNELGIREVWGVFGCRVVPLLALAAAGEATWIVRLRVLEPDQGDQPGEGGAGSA